MRARPRWVPWARASLLCSLLGHVVANAVLDEGQYEAAGLEYGWAASAPLLIQAILVLGVVVALGRLGRRPDASQPPPRRRALLAGFVSSQVLAFLMLEISERLVQHEPFVEGIFSSGFTLELAFALAAAVVLAAVGSVALRIARAIRRSMPTVPRVDLVTPPLSDAPPRRAIALAVGVRAPPVSAV
jgi:hypothetical protein